MASGTNKVLLVASSGGHLLQLYGLRDLWPQENRVWVTFDRPDARSLLASERVIYAFSPTNRSALNFIRNAALATRTFNSVPTRAIVTTGAGVAVPFCYAARLFGIRVVYIESLTRITSPSLTGRLVHPVAHAFFVQWPELLPHFHRAQYRGSILDFP